MSQNSKDAGRSDGQATSLPTEKEAAARDLAHAVDEAAFARLRFQKRTRAIGFHGEDFDLRAARAEGIVEKFNELAVKNAQKNALRAGWTKEQLASSAVDGAAQGLGSARA